MSVREFLIVILLWLIASGCGMKFKVDGNPRVDVAANGQFSVQPNFEQAAAFCDDRYGSMSKEAEECFADFREYFKITVGVDLDSITKYCETKWKDDVSINSCEEELLEIISLVNKE